MDRGKGKELLGTRGGAGDCRGWEKYRWGGGERLHRREGRKIVFEKRIEKTIKGEEGHFGHPICP